MKKYTNTTSGLRKVTLSDGVSYFLKRGESISSDKGVKHMQEGIKESSVRKVRRVSSPDTEDKSEG